MVARLRILIWSPSAQMVELLLKSVRVTFPASILAEKDIFFSETGFSLSLELLSTMSLSEEHADNATAKTARAVFIQ